MEINSDLRLDALTNFPLKSIVNYVITSNRGALTSSLSKYSMISVITSDWGAFTNLLWKSTVNSVIIVLLEKIRQWISEEGTDMFSIEINAVENI